MNISKTKRLQKNQKNCKRDENKKKLISSFLNFFIMLEETKKRVCPQCKIAFIPRRSNQIFYDSRARSAYHNNRNNAIRKNTAYIQKPLMKTYKVFSELLADKDEGIFHNEFLLGKGVSFEVFTNLKKYKDGIAYSVFEFWYVKVDDVNFQIKRYGRRK